MRTKRAYRSTAIFKCVITMSNGMHQIVRMTIDKVARFAAAMRDLHTSPWLTRRYEEFFAEIGVNYKTLKSCRFINERTGEILIEV